MPKKGHQYPIDTDWKARVKNRMSELGITQNELSRRAKISKTSLSQALSDASLQAAFLPEIHKALGWLVPPLVFSQDALEMLAQYEALDEFERGVQLERLRTKAEEARRRKRN